MHTLGMSRRRLLRGSAAGALSFLPVTRLLEGAAHTQGNARVLILLYHPFGVEEPEFLPTGGETDFALKSGSQPLQAVRNDVVIFRNLDNLAGEDSHCARGEDQHVGGVRTLWTGASRGNGTKAVLWGPSIDQVAGAHLQQKFSTRFAAYNFGVRASPDGHPASPGIAQMFMDARGQLKKPEDNPIKAYDQLFGSGVPKPPDNGAEAAKRLAARRSLMDHVVGEAKRFEAALVGGERERFQSHVEALRSFETKLTDRMNEVAQKNLSECGAPARGGFTVDHESTDIWKTILLQRQLLLLSLSCGLTNVATLSLTRGFSVSYKVPPLLHTVSEGPYDAHSLSHDGPRDSAKLQTNLTHAWSKEFAALVQGLKNTVSPRGGSLFDESIILWSSCISGRGGGGHTRVKIPFVLGAGKQAGFKTGRFVDAAGRAQNPIFLSTCQALGMNLNTFGDAQYCPGPMTALTNGGQPGGYGRPAGGYGCQGT